MPQEIDIHRFHDFIELGYTFEISWKGYRVEYNGELIHGAAIYTGGYDYKEPHWKRKAANKKDFWLQALSTAEQHHQKEAQPHGRKETRSRME